jgi:hypothetical protein
MASLLRSLSPRFHEAAEIVLAGVCAVPVIALPLLSSRDFAAALAVLALVGMLFGAALALLQILTRPLATPLRLSVWLGLGAALGLWEAIGLGALQKLDGPHAGLSLATLAAGGLGGAALGTWLFALAPDANGRASSHRWPLPGRAALAAVIALAVIGVELVESLPGPLSAYPSARRAIAWTCWIVAVSLVGLVIGPRGGMPSRWRARLHWLLALLLIAAGLCVCAARQATFDHLASADQTRHALNFLRAVTDWDFDGVSSLFGGGDCAPFDASISPRAPEIPGNGRDDNCRFGDAPSRPPLRQDGPRGPEGPGSTMNVVLVTVDALRPDHLGAYGYGRGTTPHIDALASQSVRFEHAYTSAPFTTLALPSLLAGVYPSHLAFRPVGLSRSEGIVSLAPDGRFPARAKVILPLSEPTDEGRWLLQEALRRHGMRTAAAISIGVGDMRAALGRGWERLEVAREEDDCAVTAIAKSLFAAPRREPVFLWLHYYDTHEINHARSGVASFGDSVIDRYDHQVAAVDQEIGDLMAAIDADASRPTVVVFTADHGESLIGPVQFHGADLYEDTVRIPLLLRIPGRPPAVITTPVSLVDIAPTLLALTGAPSPTTLDGEDLMAPRASDSVFTELWRIGFEIEPIFDQVSITDRNFRLVYDRLLDAFTLARTGDLHRPPDELPLQRAPSALLRKLESFIDERQRLPWASDMK